MVNYLTLEQKIKTAIAVVVQENTALWYSILYDNDTEENAYYKGMLLNKVKEYLVGHYGLYNNDLDDNAILTMLNNEDEFSLFALNL